MNTNEIPTPRGAYRTKAMNLDQIPTPESDNCYRECVLTPSPGNGLVMRSKMRDLERRLTVARETLWGVHDTSSSSRLRRVAKETLTLTAPKQ